MGGLVIPTEMKTSIIDLQKYSLRKKQGKNVQYVTLLNDTIHLVSKHTEF